ncbi:MAG: hypothetical protein ABJC62_14165 [Frankiaceae bacterium]
MSNGSAPIRWAGWVLVLPAHAAVVTCRLADSFVGRVAAEDRG